MKILSIQSHVSYGHVGNSCATFPLQLLGHEVIPIHTVNFSNHTGHKGFRGHYTSKEQILDIFNGLLEIQDLEIDALLTGYLGDSLIVEAIVEVYGKLKARNENLLYFCDPVMGDHGNFYVKEGIPALVEKKLLPIANYIFPNFFEFNHLTRESGQKSVKEKAQELLVGRSNLKGIVLSSFLECEKMKTFLFQREDSFYVETKALELSSDIRMVGTGDLLSALFVGNLLKGSRPEESLENSVSSLFQVLKKTIEKNRVELDLIESQDLLLARTLFSYSRF